MKKIVLFIFMHILCISVVNATESDTTFKSGISMKNPAILENYPELDTINIDKIVVEKITAEKLKKITENKISLIHIWGSWCPTALLGLDEIRELIDKKTDCEIILISADISSKEQVDFMKKILAFHNIRIKTYILEKYLGIEDANDITNKLKEFTTFDHIYNLVHSFDKEYKKIDVGSEEKEMYIAPIPYTALIDKNQNILFSQIPKIVPNTKECPPDLYTLDIKKITELIKKK